MNKIVFTISGKAGHGKDTLALVIRKIYQERGKTTRRLAFADYLKQEAELLGWDGKKDDKGRTLLQDLSVLTKTYHGLDYYVKRVEKNIEHFRDDVFTITDTRYPYELKPVPHAINIRVERSGYDNGLTKKQQKHESEVALDNHEFDLIIYNDLDEDFMEQQMLIFLEEKDLL